MTDLAHTDSTDLTNRTLDELAGLARESHQLAITTAISAVTHAVRVGEVLLEVRQRIGYGGFERWVHGETEIAYTTANHYMRMAYYKDELPEPDDITAWGRPGAGRGIAAAQRLLVGLPPIPKAHGGSSMVATDSERALAASLHKEGLQYKEIAERLERSVATIYSWINPDYAKRQKARTRQRDQRNKKARRLLEEQEARDARQTAAHSIGGAVGEAYSTLRKHLDALDRAISAVSEDDAAFYALRRAQSFAYKAEDAFSEALRVV